MGGPCERSHRAAKRGVALGMPAPNAKVLSLSETAPDAEEGAFIVPHGGYYYLFVSAGACCKGIGSSYQVIVGRSAQITGPYVDPNGTLMTDDGGMELLGSNEGMVGPGSPSVYVGSNGDLIDYHYYDAWDNGDPWIQVRELLWTSTGVAGHGAADGARARSPSGRTSILNTAAKPSPGGMSGLDPGRAPRLLVAAGGRPHQGVRRLVLRLELLQPRRRMPAGQARLIRPKSIAFSASRSARAIMTCPVITTTNRSASQLWTKVAPARQVSGNGRYQRRSNPLTSITSPPPAVNAALSFWPALNFPIGSLARVWRRRCCSWNMTRSHFRSAGLHRLKRRMSRRRAWPQEPDKARMSGTGRAMPA